MAKAVHSVQKPVPEVRFWACFAVVFALLAQALFPVQALAMSPDQPYGVLCNSGISPDAVKNETSPEKSHLMGLKCADCVIASVTGLPEPQTPSIPIIYTVEDQAYQVLSRPQPVKARAPPRPHSCGPPAIVQA